MKNQIQAAYDRLSPTAEQKQRMEREIFGIDPYDVKNGKQYYTARPYVERRFAVIPFLVTIFLVLLGVNWMLGLLPWQKAGRISNPELSAATVTVAHAATERDTPFGPGTYDDYVNWILQREVSYPFLEDGEDSCYVLYDLNGDGVRELMIGSKDGAIVEAVTCLDGELQILFAVGRGFRICTDGSILTGSLEEKEYVIYRMEGERQWVDSTIWYSEEEHCWYCFRGLDNQIRPLTDQEFVDLLASFQPMELEMKELSDYPSQEMN